MSQTKPNGRKQKTHPLRTFIYAGDGFSSFHLSIPFLVLEAPNIKDFFDLSIFTLTGKEVSSSNSLLTQKVHSISDLDTADIIIIPDWPSRDKEPPSELIEALQSAHSRGVQIVGLCLGAYALSYAGITKGRKVATHWGAENDFLKRFPDTHLDINTLYAEDDNLLTSAGGAASLDCCLYLVKKLYGNKQANAAAKLIVFPSHRDGGQAQFIDRPIPETAAEERLKKLLPWLIEHIELPHTVEGLSSRLWMSKRTFNRHFLKLTGSSFKDWIMNERLKQAQDLLTTTSLRIDEIAFKTGYPKEQSFRSAFKKKFKTTPSNWRNRQN